MTEDTTDTQANRETPIELLGRVTKGLTSRRDVLGTTAKVGAGGALLSAGAGTAAAGGMGEGSSADTASVTFDDQDTTGTSVTVAKVTLPEGGFVAIHDSSLLDGAVLESVIGVTEYLEAGTHEDVHAMLFTSAVKGADFDMETLEEDDTLIAMPHMDTNGNDMYDFVNTGGKQDGPYTAEGEAVVDDGTVTVVEEMEDSEGMEDDVSDLDILNYALTLEHLEAAYYNQFLDEYSESDVERSDVAAIFADGGSRYSTYQKIEEVRDHEEAHVEALTQTIQDLGGEPVEPAEYAFPYESVEEFAALSATIESVGVSAYAGAAPLIENPDLHPPALSIHSVEARHTSYFNVLDTTSPFPNAFDPARTMEEVLEIASGFIVGMGNEGEKGEEERTEEFSADLAGENEVPPVDTEGEGEAMFTLSDHDDGPHLHYELHVEDIENVTQAHIHVGSADENGDVVAFLFEAEAEDGVDVGDSERLAEGSLTADDLVGPLEGMDLAALAEEMRAGNTYANVHTTQNPAGEIRGQIQSE